MIFENGQVAMECEADAQGVGTHFPIATTLAQSAILRPKLWERVRMMMNDSRQYAPATLRNRDFILGILRDVLPTKGVILEIASGSGEHVVHFARNLPSLFSNLPIESRTRCRVSRHG